MGEVIEREFLSVKLGHQLIDSVAMLMVKNLRALNRIIVTSNLFADIISDEASIKLPRSTSTCVFFTCEYRSDTQVAIRLHV